MRALITGHADFATGLKSALELIAGPQEQLQHLPFTEATNLAEFQEQLVQFSNVEDEEAVIFTDLLGGTPFNMAMTAKANNDRIHIFTGTNLPLLLEFISLQMLDTDKAENLEKLAEASRAGINFDVKIGLKDTEESDGI